MSANLIALLRTYKVSFLKVLADEEKRNQYARFYDLLEVVLEGRALNERSAREILAVDTPAPLKPFLTSAGFPFLVSPEEAGSNKGALKLFLKVAGQAEWRGIVEVLLLRRAAENQLHLLDSPFLGAAALKIRLAPTLDLNCIEEGEQADASETLFRIPIEIVNSGKLALRSLLLRIEATNPRTLRLGDLSAPLKRRHATVLDVVLQEGGVHIHRLNLWTVRGARISVECEAQIPAKSGTVLRSNSLNVLLGGAESGGYEAEGRFANPYLPDLPLTTDEQWEEMAKGEHAAIVKRVTDDPDLRAGRVFVVRGLRKVGKTSVLQRLRRLLEDGDTYLPVFVDVYLWHLSLEGRRAKIGNAALNYEIAHSVVTAALDALKEASSLGVASQEEQLRDVLKENEGRTELPIEDLESRIDRVREIVRKEVVILVDDLDYWFRKETFSESQGVLAPLIALPSRKHVCSLVLSHDWTTKAWQDYFREGSSVLPMRVHLLSRDDTCALARMSPIPFSDLAMEVLWRVSGGWPGVVQLLCYVALQNLRDSKQRQVIIDVRMMKQVIGYVIKSQDYRLFFEHFLSSFQREEIELMRALAIAPRIDLDSLVISGIEYSLRSGFSVSGLDELGIAGEASNTVADTLRSLVEKEVIEPVSDNGLLYQLRVGFLGYGAVYGQSLEVGVEGSR